MYSIFIFASDYSPFRYLIFQFTTRDLVGRDNIDHSFSIFIQETSILIGAKN